MLCDVSVLRRISWFRVSKAFLRSMNTAVGGVLSLRFKASSSSSVASVIEVDLFLLLLSWLITTQQLCYKV